ncbi:hypothetical protein HF325_006274 [Metschnikowia pulcherrima]|uniref:Uncharacterized protein n=1 Tax=Metschnikowia pulcherrima TaxID=27326 RepID=A0A8H7GM37_9ASCO|nr:hypothetical protein HF325_006274 [Metschnikowia pulcherrima]
MKLSICALLSTVVLALTTSAPSQNSNAVFNAADVPKGFPSNVAELGKMVDKFNADLDKAYDEKINVEKWHLARMEFKFLESAAEWIQPRLRSHEQWHINHTISEFKRYVLPRRDAQAVLACKNGDRSRYCLYYSFQLYAADVEGLEIEAKAWTDFYVSDNLDADMQASINIQLASTKVKIDRLRAAPAELWKTEPRAEEVQKNLDRSTDIIDAALAAIQAKRS